MSTNGDEVGRRWREETEAAQRRVERYERRRLRSILIAVALTLALVIPINTTLVILLRLSSPAAIALGILGALAYVPVRLLVLRRRGV